MVAACPSGQTFDESLICLERKIHEIERQKFGSPSELTVVEVSAPTLSTNRQLEKELFDRYHHALFTVRIKHRSEPRFKLENLADYNARTTFGQLAAFLEMQSPSLVVIRDAQNFATPRASLEDIRAKWRIIIDIARQSRIPHLIAAPTATVSSVVYDDPEILADLIPAVLEPYHKGDSGNMPAFFGVLNDFNKAMPWETKDSLMAHWEEIDSGIAGDVSRLRDWIVRAVTCALTEPETTRVSWRHFLETKPLSAQRNYAQSERNEALTMLGRTDSWPDKSEKAAHSEPPKEKGNRKPGRTKNERSKLYAAAVLPR